MIAYICRYNIVIIIFIDKYTHAPQRIIKISIRQDSACCLFQAVISVVGVLGGVGVPVQGLGLGGEVVFVVVAPLDGVAVPLSGLLIAHKAVLEVVEVLGASACGAVRHDPQIAAVVVAVAHRVAVFIGFGSGATQGIICVRNGVPVAVGGASEGAVAVRRVGMAHQRPLADPHAAELIECPIGEVIGRAGGGGDGRQKCIGGVSVPHLRILLADAGGAQPAVVGIIGTIGVRLVWLLHPVQNARLGVIVIGSRLPQRVRHGGKLVSVGGIGGRGGNGLRLAAAAHRHLGVVAVGVIGEAGHHALGACGREDIVVAVVAVGLAGAAGQGDLGEVIVGVFIGGVLLLQVRDAGDVAISIIDIAVAELLLE